MTKPVLIVRHDPLEGPGYFAEWLDGEGISWRLVRVDRRDPIPATASGCAGVVFMGGPMSVNDELPWIPEALRLIRDAVSREVPVLGHCLGGQLVAKALGGVVGPAPVKEIGWGPVDVVPSSAARAWFGETDGFTAFQWHGERFSIPVGAERVLSGPFCDNQGFALGPHLALQCHVEMTAELVRSWCDAGRREIARSLESPAVQPADDILAGADARLVELQRMAARIYSRWAARLAVT